MIELSNLSRHYSMADTDVTVLQQLNLSVEATERVAIVGPSGSGKTTLLLILTGLESPSDGTVKVAQQSLTGMSPDQRADLRRKHIGIVFQSFHLIPTLTARENVALPLEIGGQRNSRKQALAMLDKVGLSARASHYPAQLSGGEQQRVAIARALVHEPELIVADEPTGNLDEHTGDRIMQLLFDLNRDHGTTLLLVTHDHKLAAHCDKTLQLGNGSLHEIDSAALARVQSSS
ncbi:ABC transporter ATP-binding protein [Chromatiales bacterium (ex Bugula neritina AB1)]|nr:ABC transporter ATP-binding protein [Chromatiales bacterium (ex Bugula neritina AB1)]